MKNGQRPTSLGASDSYFELLLRFAAACGYEILAEKSKINTIKTYLKIWRTQLYLKNAEELKAIPFYEETLKRKMANSFVELHNYAKHSKEKKVKA